MALRESALWVLSKAQTALLHGTEAVKQVAQQAATTMSRQTTPLASGAVAVKAEALSRQASNPELQIEPEAQSSKSAPVVEIAPPATKRCSLRSIFHCYAGLRRRRHIAPIVPEDDEAVFQMLSGESEPLF
ncbi:hypothetical protein EBZ37_11485 [bacterium]|nr:hypothetical protein [bacterium]